MKTFYLLIIIIQISIVDGYSQALENSFYDETWSLKVKQIDDFVDRFNNELNFISNGKIIKNKLPSDTRIKLLSSLIYSENVKNPELVNEFVNMIDTEGFYLKFGDDDIKCILSVASLFNENPFNFDFHLKIEKLDDGAMKWVIVDVNSTSYPWNTIAKNPQKFINPSNHNLRFSNLFRIINGDNDIQGILEEDFELDNLSIIIHQIISGNMAVKSIIDVNYSFDILQKYNALVSYFDTPGKQSGWLISNIVNLETK